MGGDLMHIEKSMIEENVRKLLVWYMLKKGGICENGINRVKYDLGNWEFQWVADDEPIN